MSFCICCSILFTVSVFNLTFFQPLFHRDKNVVFVSLIILFINSTVALYSCVNMDVFLGSVGIWFWIFYVSIRFGARLEDFLHSLPVHIFLLSLFQISRFLKFKLAQLASLWLVWSLADSIKIINIRLLYLPIPSLRRIAFEIPENYLSSIVHFSFDVSQIHCYLGIRLCFWNKNR